jgi:hypothetical protein
VASLSSYGGKLSSLGGLLSSNGGRLSNFGSGAPAAVTTDFSYAQFEGGQSGLLDTATIGTRTYWGAGGRTVWAGYITGTAALFTAVRKSGTLATGNVVVSVDGATATNAVLADGKFTLFSGLTDTAHHVHITAGAAMGGNLGVTNTGTILTVTGAAPALVVADDWLQFFDDNALALSVSQRIVNPTGYTAYTPSNSAKSATNYVHGHRFKTDADKLEVVTPSRYLYISVDGGAPTRYDRGATVPTINSHTITLDGALHTYNVWARNQTMVDVLGVLAIGIVGGTFSDVGTKVRLDQFGSSTTEGVSATSPGDVETMGVAAHFGMLGTTYGVAGENFAGTKARLTTLLPLISPTTADTAVFAVGTNNLSDGIFDETEQADCLDCINQMRAVYGQVIVRGVLPNSTEDRAGPNATLATIVSDLADPNVVFVNTSSWTGIIYSDEVHPTDAGYDVIEAYCKTDYAAYLP